MKASDYIIRYLLENKIDKVFGYIGGMIAHIVDSIAINPEMEMINTLHEQGAGFAAEGYARYSNKTGVAIATSGPGATNLLTAVGSCYFDSVPTLFITGQVNTYEYKNDLPIRQRGFQETDIAAIAKPITKYSVMVSDAKNLRYELEKCLYLTQHGRKGPVLMDIPMNIQRADLNIEEEKSFFDSDEHKKLQQEIKPDFDISEVITLIKNAKRPVILAGGGIQISNAQAELETFLEKSQMPIVTSLMGLDCVNVYEHNMGLIGAYGNRYGNLTLANADLVLALGTRLDSRQTGTNTDLFLTNSKIIRVDIDKYELEHSTIKATVSIKSDAKSFLQRLNETEYNLTIDEWYKKLAEFKNKYPSTHDIKKEIKNPNLFIEKLSEFLKYDDIISVDVGQHQMWAAQSLNLKSSQRVFFSGGMGSMGFSLPAGIGATIASGKRSIIVTGDGGLQMNIQELELLKRRNLPIKIIVMNNSCLGMVRQFQELYFESRYLCTVEDYSAPDFSGIAKAYGVNGYKTDINKNWQEALKGFLADDKPGLLDVYFNRKTDVEPKLIVNQPIENMFPYLPAEELKENMIATKLEKTNG